MSRKTRPLLRAVPLAVLTSIVVVAVISRRTAREARETPALRSASIAQPMPLTVGSGAAQVFAPPLRSPTPPASAEVPEKSARMMHGSPAHAHRVRARGPQTAEKIAFRVSVAGPVAAQVTASPDESTLYVSTLHGQLVALNRIDGAKRWSISLGDRVYGAPLVHEDGTIYVGSDAKKFFAISPAKGDFVFRLDTEGEADTSAVFGRDGAIIFAAGIHVHSARRGGDVAWRFAAKNKVYTSPAITRDGLTIVGSQDHHVYAIGPGGNLAWAVDLAADVDGAPVVGDDGAIYVGTDGQEVVRLDPTKGSVVWRMNVGGFVRGCLSIARNGDVLAGTYGPVPRVVRLTSDGLVRGAFAIQGTGAREFGIHGAPLEDEDGTLYFGAQDDAAYAIGVDGAVKWRFVTGGDIDAPLSMLSDGSLIVPSEDGTVTLLLP